MQTAGMDVVLSPLPRDQFTAWHDAARERMISRNLASGMRVGDDAAEHVDRMLTQLFATNAAAVALYESLGYERVQEYLVMDAL